MKLLDRRHEGRAGVYASILASGPVRIDDPIEVLD
jgi:MOSC domain-containing protein YiiM